MELLSSLHLSPVNLALTAVSITLCACAYLKHKFSYWDRLGIPYIHPAKAFLYILQLTFKKLSFMEFFQIQHKALEGHKFGGSFQMMRPMVVLRDPETIRAWLVKGFTSFHDRNPKPDENFDPLMASLFQLTGERWRQVRHKLSPAFSSAKLKIMFEALKQCAGELDIHLEKLCSTLKSGDAEINVKELMSNYTMDVIGACAMGIKCNAIQDPNSNFKRIVLKIFKMDIRKSIYFFLLFLNPKLPKFFGLKIAPEEVNQFLRNVCKETEEMKTKDASSSRKDFLQILMNLQAAEKEQIQKASKEQTENSEPSEDGPVFTENMLLAITSNFLLAGLEPVASALTFCLYELALNPEIQDKVFNEIQAVKKDAGEGISYETLKKFKYTEQVINETLRKYPPATALARMCTEPFQIPDSSVVLDKGVSLFISLYSLHHDAKNFPEPEKFDPDRFSPENIEKIVPGSYLPFGDGPRFCIAMRLALLDIKTLVITIISKYSIEACTRTMMPMKFDQNCAFLAPKSELWLRIKKRK